MKKGFTLVELLVVISIISILTVVTAGQFQTAQRKAMDVSRKGDLNGMVKSLEMYYADYGVFPIGGAAVSNLGQMIVGGNPIPWGTTFQDLSTPPYIYMKVLPKENKTGMPSYCYVTDPTGKEFGIFAMLENTTDSQCAMNGDVGAYSHCGGKKYCYAVVSPNASVSDLSTFEP